MTTNEQNGNGPEQVDGISAALTPEESYHGTVWPCDSRLYVAGPIPQRHLGGPSKDGGWSLITYPNGGRHSGQGPRVVLDLTAEDAHKAAAMLLQGNPHGFTREQATALRCVLWGWDGYLPDDAPMQNDEAVRALVEGLAAALDAILPSPVQAP